MQTLEFLDKSGARYEITEHRPVFTAQRMAAEEHESGKYVAKPVVCKVDDKYVMCVLPACCKVDLEALKNQFGAKSVKLAEEKEFSKLFPDCDLGAEAPFGSLYDMPTIMDKALECEEHIMFQAGTHEKAVRMSMEDYLKLAKPRILDFSYHMSF